VANLPLQFALRDLLCPAIRPMVTNQRRESRVILCRLHCSGVQRLLSGTCSAAVGTTKKRGIVSELPLGHNPQRHNVVIGSCRGALVLLGLYSPEARR
jgi:hypothetical protein